jgi:hypothetical protein
VLAMTSSPETDCSTVANGAMTQAQSGVGVLQSLLGDHSSG